MQDRARVLLVGALLLAGQFQAFLAVGASLDRFLVYTNSWPGSLTPTSTSENESP